LKYTKYKICTFFEKADLKFMIMTDYSMMEQNKLVAILRVTKAQRANAI